MANKYRGESRLEIENVVYTLVYNSGTLVALEDRLKMGFIKILKMCGSDETISITLLRVLLHEGLRERHKDITVEQAGDMILGAGFGNVLDAIMQAYTAAAKLQATDEPENPPKPSQPPKLGIGSE